MDFLNLVTALGERLHLDIPKIDYPNLATLSHQSSIWPRSSALQYRGGIAADADPIQWILSGAPADRPAAYRFDGRSQD